MELLVTEAVDRALRRSLEWCDPPPATIGPAALLLGLLGEAECRAALILAEHGVDAAAVCQRWPELERRDPTEGPEPSRRLSSEVRASWRTASSRLVDCPQPLVFGTEHVLLGLAAADHCVAEWLRERGVDPGGLARQIERQYGLEYDAAASREPIDWPEAPVAPTAAAEAPTPPGPLPPVSRDRPCRVEPASREAMGALRAFDAAGNRAREGLRVVEDYARFVLDDRFLSGECKRLRHELAALVGRVPLAGRLAARDTPGDVGTTLSVPTEGLRKTLADVLAANGARLAEGLRSLEEFAKLLEPALAAEFERLRYRSYVLERAVSLVSANRRRLEGVRLYVLLDGRASLDEFERQAAAIVAGGAHAIQLRDKTLDDRRLLERARRLRAITSSGPTLMIVNDRPDLAALSGADGVHVGQDELSVRDARAVVGPGALVGVSTHNLEQAHQAVLEGADYLGVGPVFPSSTKQFDRFPGLELLRQVSAEIGLPAFAIGGIDAGNIAQALAAGCRRVAVGGAVASASDPAAAVGDLLARLGP